MATHAAGIHARARRIGRAPSVAWAFAQLPPIARTVIRERLTYLAPIKMLEFQRAVREYPDVLGRLACPASEAYLCGSVGACGGSVILACSAIEGVAQHLV